MKIIIKLTILLILIGLFVPRLLLADTSICTEETPCIVSVLASKVIFYNADLTKAREEKRRAFEKRLKGAGLVTEGREEIQGITLLKIKDPDSDEIVYLEENAFQLDPKPKIDCSGVVTAQTGTSSTSTSGVSVGLGDSCNQE